MESLDAMFPPGRAPGTSTSTGLGGAGAEAEVQGAVVRAINPAALDAAKATGVFCTLSM